MGAVMDFFVPREKKFLKMLDDAAENVMRGIVLFSDFITTFSELKRQEKEEYLTKIEEIEHRGDKITHVINDQLNLAFITPIDKEDIHQLSVLLDDVIDLIYSTTKQIVLYDLKKIDKCVLELARIIQEGVKETRFIVGQLKKIQYAKKNAVLIHQLENEADEIYQKGMAELYTKKQDITEMIKLKDVYYNLELTTDKIEDISVVIQNIIIKNG